MEKNVKILLAGGIIIAVASGVLIDIYAALIVVVIMAAVMIPLWIMKDSMYRPDVYPHLAEDARSIELVNRGNSAALNIHADIVPFNIGVDVPKIEPDARVPFAFQDMVTDAKVLLTFENEHGQKFSATHRISAMVNDEDLLRPAFPLFKWK